jgi:hypothetical protein
MPETIRICLLALLGGALSLIAQWLYYKFW